MVPLDQMTKAQAAASPNTLCERGDGVEHREGGTKERDSVSQSLWPTDEGIKDDSDRKHRAEKSCPLNEVEEKSSRFRHRQGDESFQLRERGSTSHSTSTNSNPYSSNNVPSRDDERCTVLPPHKRVELSRRTTRHRKFQDSIDPSERKGEGVSKMSTGEEVHVNDKFVSNAIELSVPLDSEDDRSLEPKNNESVKSLSSDADDFLTTFKHIQMEISNTSISGFLHTILSSFTNQVPVCEMEDEVQDVISPNNSCERGNEECYVEEHERSDIHIMSERGRDSTGSSKVHGTVSSIDGGCSVLPPHKRLELSRRTFQRAPHKRMELSRRTFQQRTSQDSIDTSEPMRDSFVDFEDYHSMQNWSDSKNEELEMSPSSDVESLKSSTNDQTEMSKVDELREEIDEMYDKSDEREGTFHLGEEKLTPQLDLNCTRFPSLKARRQHMRDSSVDFDDCCSMQNWLDSKNEELVMSLSSDAEFLNSSTNDQMEMSKVNELREEIDEKYDRSDEREGRFHLGEEKLTPQLDLNCTRFPSLKASKEG